MFEENYGYTPFYGTAIRTISNCQASAEVKVILPTAKVRIRNGEKEVIARVALDSGAENTFVTRKLVDELGLDVKDTGDLLEIHGYGDQISLEHAKTVKLELMSMINNEVFTIDWAYVEEGKVCGDFEAFDLDVNEHANLAGLQFADEIPRGDVEVDVLLGQRHYYSVVGGEVRKPENPGCMPTATETLFGYVVSGPYIPKKKRKKSRRMKSTELFAGTKVYIEDNLDSKLEKFWRVESVGIISEERPLTGDERMAVRHFEENVKFNGERYVVALPFREDAVPLESNYGNALRILESTERRLLRNPVRRKQFTESIESYEKNGFAHELTEKEEKDLETKEHYYVPALPVFRESESTPTRTVFNASSTDKKGNSLNDMLLPGPPIQPDLVQVLIRFRWHSYVITGDLKKMFCQTKLIPDHHRYQLFLWRDCDQSVKPKKYAMDSLMFGVTSSPFLAGSSVHKHSEREDMVEMFQRLVKEIKKNTYVDDHYNGRETPKEAIELFKQLVEFFAAGGWVIKKFATNSKEVLENIPESDRIASLTLDFDQDDYGQTRALGLTWRTDQDVLSCKVTDELITPAKKLTKRIITSKVASVYDVFGFVAPYVIRAKIIMQDLWKLGIGWDDPIKEEEAKRFRRWESELPQIADVKLPRRFLPEGIRTKTIDLHGFADASEEAYGCVMYLRTKTQDGAVTTSFVMAKTRVAPIKRIELARLELLAAETLAYLMKYVIEAFMPLEIEIENVYGWSDSEITLSWIARPSSQWKTFVSNRVQHIHGCFSPSIWNWCPGPENPADKLSRGMTLMDLKNDDNYWNGPNWLKKAPEYWPAQDRNRKMNPEAMAEAAKIKIHSLFTTSKEEDDDEEKSVIQRIGDRREKFKTVVRVLAWVLRWRRLVQEKAKRGKELTAEEVEYAEKKIWREVQREHFSEEYERLSQGKKVDKKSLLLKWDPEFNEDDELIVVGGRLQFAEMPCAAKHPILLPKGNKLVRKMIHQKHVDHQHAAKETTIAMLRERYAIGHIRQEVRSVVRGCRVCRRAQTRPVEQKMGVLPPERVQIAPAFTEMGVDFTGALWITDGTSKKTKKCYILVCTCPASRMVHFELTENMTTEELIQALRRVMNRRGKSRKIHSDNQTSFKKAKKVISAAFDREIRNLVRSPEVERFLVDEGIEWEFITERSPFRGGYWERLNRSLKEPLKKIVGKALLSYTELYTILTDIECTLNQRPLTYTGGEPGDPLPITPAHLALGRSLNSFPDVPASTEVPVGKRYRNLQRLLRKFWKRWTTEYLPKLTERKKWRQENPPLQVGDVCLITEEGTARPTWPIGRVVEIAESRGGVVRTVRLKTAKGFLNRPIQRLHVLEPAVRSEDPDTTEKPRSTASSPEVPEVTNATEHDQDDPPEESRSERDVLVDDSEVNQGGVCSRFGRSLRPPDRYGL